MRRRDFIAGLGSTGLALPLPAQAQQRTIPMIGYLYAATEDGNRGVMPSFHQGLAEQGLRVDVHR